MLISKTPASTLRAVINQEFGAKKCRHNGNGWSSHLMTKKLGPQPIEKKQSALVAKNNLGRSHLVSLRSCQFDFASFYEPQR